MHVHLALASCAGSSHARPARRGVRASAALGARAGPRAPPAASGERLRELLRGEEIVVMPSCHDAMTGRLIQEAGFKAAFMSGYAVSYTRLGLPDVGLATYTEMEETGRNIVNACESLLVIGDGDTGFGGSANVMRTVEGYARAGFAGISIEDQMFPKRCAFAKGVLVEPRGDAVKRMKAAIAARDRMKEAGLDILVVGRTDCRLAANVDDGFEEAMWRCQAFQDAGADIVYFEGPQSREEMEALNKVIEVPTMLAQVEKPDREILDLGYDLLLNGLTLLNVQMAATREALRQWQSGTHPTQLLEFDDLYKTVGFDDYIGLDE